MSSKRGKNNTRSNSYHPATSPSKIPTPAVTESSRQNSQDIPPVDKDKILEQLNAELSVLKSKLSDKEPVKEPSSEVVEQLRNDLLTYQDAEKQRVLVISALEKQLDFLNEQLAKQETESKTKDEELKSFKDKNKHDYENYIDKLSIITQELDEQKALVLDYMDRLNGKDELLKSDQQQARIESEEHRSAQTKLEQEIAQLKENLNRLSILQSENTGERSPIQVELEKKIRKLEEQIQSQDFQHKSLKMEWENEKVELEEKLAAQNVLVSKNALSLKSREVDIEKQQQQLNELQRKLLECSGKENQLQSTIWNLETELNDKKIKMNEMTTLLKAETTNFEEQISYFKSEITQGKGRESEYESKIDLLRRQLDEALDNRRKMEEEWKLTLEETKMKQQQMQTEIKGHKSNLATHDDMMKKLKAEHEQWMNEKEVLQSQLYVLERQGKESAEKCTKLESQVEKYEQEILEKEKEIVTLEDRVKLDQLESRESNNHLRDEIRKCKLSISQYQETIQDLTRQLDSQKAIYEFKLESADKDLQRSNLHWQKELDTYKHENIQLKDNAAKNMEEALKLQNQLREKDDFSHVLQTEIQVVRKHVIEKQEKIVQLEQTTQKVQDELQVSQSDSKAMEQRFKAEAHQNKEKMVQMQDGLMKSKLLTAEYQENLSYLQKEYDNQKLVLEKRLLTLTAENEKDFERAKSELKTYQRQSSQLNENLSAQVESIVKLQGELRAKEDELVLSKTQVVALEKQLKEYQEKYTQGETVIPKLELQLKTKDQDIQALEVRIQQETLDSQERIKVLREEIQRQKNLISDLEECKILHDKEINTLQGTWERKIQALQTEQKAELKRFAGDLDCCNKEIAYLKETLTNEIDTSNKLKSQIRDKDELLQQSHTSALTLQRELKDDQAKIAALESSIQKYKAELFTREKDIGWLEERQANDQSANRLQLNKQLEMNSELRKKIAGLEKDVQVLENELSHKQAMFVSEERSRIALMTRLEELDSQTRLRLKSANEEYEAKLTGYTNIITDLQRRILEVEKTLNAQRLEYMKIQNAFSIERQKLVSNVDTFEKQAAQLQKECELSKNKIQDLQAKLQALNGEMSDSMIRESEQKNEIQRLTGLMSSIQQTCDVSKRTDEKKLNCLESMLSQNREELNRIQQTKFETEKLLRVTQEQLYGKEKLLRTKLGEIQNLNYEKRTLLNEIEHLRRSEKKNRATDAGHVSHKNLVESLIPTVKLTNASLSNITGSIKKSMEFTPSSSMFSLADSLGDLRASRNSVAKSQEMTPEQK